MMETGSVEIAKREKKIKEMEKGERRKRMIQRREKEAQR